MKCDGFSRRFPTMTLVFAAIVTCATLGSRDALASVVPTLYVVEHTTNNDDVLAYAGSTIIPSFDINLSQATSVTLGPDGKLYVANTESGGQVYRYDAITGAAIAGNPFVVYTGALAAPEGMKFNTNGNLYIADTTQSNVQVFDPAGSPVATLNGTGGPAQPIDVAFDHATHSLYVADDSGVEKYNPATQNFFNVVLAATGGPSIPIDLAFGPDDKLYVLDYSTNSIFRYNADGTNQQTFATLDNTFVPNKMAFGPDGLLYISGADLFAPTALQGEILQISNGGSSIATYITGLNNPGFMVFATVPEPTTLCLLLAGTIPMLRRGRTF